MYFVLSKTALWYNTFDWSGWGPGQGQALSSPWSGTIVVALLAYALDDVESAPQLLTVVVL